LQIRCPAPKSSKPTKIMIWKLKHKLGHLSKTSSQKNADQLRNMVSPFFFKDVGTLFRDFFQNRFWAPKSMFLEVLRTLGQGNRFAECSQHWVYKSSNLERHELSCCTERKNITPVFIFTYTTMYVAVCKTRSCKHLMKCV